MERYIGLDVHAASTTMAIVGPSGRRIGTRVLETNGRALIEALKAIPGNRRVALEEGTEAEWLHEVLRPHVEEIVVTRGATHRGQKSDAKDAFDLAERLRTGQIGERIFKDVGPFGRLRELTRMHAMMTGDVVRTKNRLKAVFRSRGVATPDRDVYAPAQRQEWLAKLPANKRWSAEVLYAELDALSELRLKAEHELVEESRKHPACRILRTCPGFGPIRAAQFMAIVVTPKRFRTKRQLWAYCGLGIVMRSSADWVQNSDGSWRRAAVPLTRGLNRKHNTLAKCLMKGAATTAILQPTTPLGEHYRTLLAAGTKPNLAKLTIARRIASIALALWKTMEEYDPTKSKTKDSRLAS